MAHFFSFSEDDKIHADDEIDLDNHQLFKWFQEFNLLK